MSEQENPKEPNQVNNPEDNCCEKDDDFAQDVEIVEKDDITEAKDALSTNNPHTQMQDTPISTEATSSEIEMQPNKKGNKKENLLHKTLRLLFSIGFLIFFGLFINEAFIQPARTDKVLNEIDQLYKNTTPPTIESTNIDNEKDNAEEDLNETLDNQQNTDKSSVQDSNRDTQGRLLQFQALLETNEDVKGWLTIPKTNMDYVVLQSGIEQPEFYLDKNIYKKYDKAGSLFLDAKSSVETDTSNLIIHGHNMTSTDNMFHYLLDYKELNFYKERPVIQFDTIYNQSQWKIISVFVTNGNSKKEPLFDYTRTKFKDTNDFLAFIYDLKIRSLYQTDHIDINENDQLLTLSTCSYELDDYRTVVVARKVREGEDPTVDVDLITKKANKDILYPSTWYSNYGGAAEVTKTFEEALDAGEVPWYVPAKDIKE